jgi:hypothetical protein
MSRRARIGIFATIAVLGSVGIGSAAVAVGRGPDGTGPPGQTGIYRPCPHTGYTGRPCAIGHDK